MNESYIDRWKPWYGIDESNRPYGDTFTYSLGEEFLQGLDIEDWGCGYGWFKKIHKGPYIGVDGTKTQWSDIVADLREYQSKASGIWMRHVLEHNKDWKKILENACISATEKLVIITFTPDGDGEQIAFLDELQVPDIAIPWSAIDDALTHHNFSFEKNVYKTSSFYGVETVWLAKKK